MYVFIKNILYYWFLFKLYGNGGSRQEKLNQNSLFDALKSTIAMTKEESNRLFKQIDIENAGYITFGILLFVQKAFVYCIF